MAKVITLGEIMLRLSPPGNQRFVQASSFDVTYGGSEANIAMAIAAYGHQATYVSKLPSHAIGDCAIAKLRQSNVNCDFILRGDGRIGIYFLENGASVRASNVVYDRENSLIARAKPEEFDWEEIFKDADWFHTSGITPVLSENAANITLEALKYAKKMGLRTSFDLNYRGKLWQTEVEKKQQKISEMMKYVDVCFGNARDAAMVLGYKNSETDYLHGEFAICIEEKSLQLIRDKYDFSVIVSPYRESISASDNGYTAVALDKKGYYRGKKFMIHIVDRVGTGDAFVAGFLHGILEKKGTQKALDYGIASAAIKHTIPGDVNYTSVEEIEKLAEGDEAGRVIR